MTQFEHDIDIAAPIEYVFGWGNDPENWQRVMPSLVDFAVLEETEEGTRYRNTFKMLGRTTESEELYTVDEENYQTTATFDDGDIEGEIHWDYTEADDGTHVRLYGDLAAGDSLFDRAIRPIAARYLNRQFRNSLRTMQELAEAEYAEQQREVTA